MLEFYAHYREYDDEFQHISKHLQNTAETSRQIANKIKLPLNCELLGLLHDIGKYSNKFQDYFLSAIGKIAPGDSNYIDPKSAKGKIDHSTAGGQFIGNSIGQTTTQRLLAQVLSLCLVSHHGGLIDCLTVEGQDSFTKRLSRDKKQTYYDEVKQRIDHNIIERIDSIIKSGNLEKEFENLVRSSLSGCESQIIRDFYFGLLIRLVYSSLIDADRTDTADFENPKRKALSSYFSSVWDCLITDFENHIKDFKIANQIDKARNFISAACYKAAGFDTGAYLLTLPTGSGKTLASLRFALHHARKHKMDRIIYVIPYTSIIDQNAKAVRSIFKKIKDRQVVLEHHSNLSPKKDTEENQILSENWDAPIVFTTMVQFLNTLFSGGTKDARRMHQIMNSVVIFDEIQTLPVKVVHLFNNAMNYFVKNTNTTAIYCTATQPLLNSVDKTKGSLALTISKSIVQLDNDMKEVFKRVAILNKCTAGGWGHEDVADYSVRKIHDHKSVLVIVNTKAEAKAIYNECKKRFGGILFHLSTSMCPAHRKRIFKNIDRLVASKSQDSVICISTQLVEAGVDMDFGCVMRSLAGLDSIAQAAGRCNRHGLRENGEVIVFNSNQESLIKLRDIRIAQEKTKRIFDDSISSEEVILDDAAMDSFYKYYFFDRKHEMAYPISPKEIGRNDNLLNLLSNNIYSVQEHRRNYESEPVIDIRQSFKKAGQIFEAIDAPTRGVIVPYRKMGQCLIDKLCSSVDKYEISELLKRAQRYSVNLFPYAFNKLIEKGAVKETQDGSGILYVLPQYYSDEFGVSLEPVAEMPPLIC